MKKNKTEKQISVYINADLHKRLKLKAFANDTTLKHVIIELLESVK